MATDIHTLEIEFARNPAAESCLALCEAYLQQRRLMEAMVVCKKGIKLSAANDSRCRLMLVRIYEEQGKNPKAQEELLGILQLDPQNKQAQSFLTALQEGKSLKDQLVVSQGTTSSQAASTPAAKPEKAAAKSVVPKSVVPKSVVPKSVVSEQQAQESRATTQTGNEEDPNSRSVSDFFSQEVLNFKNETSEIETAGPGRLTIVGFVPAHSGSWRLTLGVGLIFLVLGVSFLGYRYWQSQNDQQKNQIFKQIRQSIDLDTYTDYKKALTLADAILKIDAKHALTLSALAYSHAMLHVEHEEAQALDKAKSYLQQALEDREENEYRIAAQALIAFSEQRFGQGLSTIKALMDKGASHPLIELEALRLMIAGEAEDKDLKLQLRRVLQVTVAQPQSFNFLGWHSLLQGEDDKASRYFEQTIQNSKHHAMAHLGRALLQLKQHTVVEDRRKDAEKSLQEILETPTSDLSMPVKATALYALAYLKALKSDHDNAAKGFQEALQLSRVGGILPLLYAEYCLHERDNLSAHEAIPPLEQAIALHHFPLLSLKLLAQAYLWSGNEDKIPDLVQKIKLMAAEDSDTQLLLGQYYYQKHDFTQALQTYKKVEMTSGLQAFAKAQLGMATALRGLGNIPKALQHMESVMAKLSDGVDNHTLAQLWCELGQDYELEKNEAKAKQSYLAGIDQDRFYADCHFFLCRVLDHGPEAKSACHTYLALDPRGYYAKEAQQYTK